MAQQTILGTDFIGKNTAPDGGRLKLNDNFTDLYTNKIGPVSGTPNGTKFLRDDLTWQTISTSGITQVDADNRYVNLDGDTMTGALTLTNGVNIVPQTGTGSKIGTATTQKLGFWNATPIVQPPATTDLKDVLETTGLIAAGGATPLNLDGGTLTTAKIIFGDATEMTTASVGGGGISQAAADARYVNLDGDTMTGLLTLGSGTAQYIYSSTSTGRQIESRIGSTASPDNVMGPNFKISRTTNVQKAALDAVTGGGSDGGEEMAALYCVNTGTSATQVQPVGGYFGARNAGTTAASPAGVRADAVGVYSVARIDGSGDGAALAGFYLGRSDSVNGKVSTIEVVANNSSGVDHNYVISGAPLSRAFWIHSLENRVGTGLDIVSPFGGQFDVGIHFNAQNSGPTVTADIRSDSQAQTGIQIAGTHSNAAMEIASGAGPLKVLSKIVFADASELTSATGGTAGTLATARQTRTEIEDDFITGAGSTQVVGALGWQLYTGTTVTPKAATGLTGRPGVITVGTPATVTTHAMFSRNQFTTGPILASDEWETQWWIKLLTLTNVNVRLGLTTDITSQTPVGGCYFEKLPAAPQWFGVTRAASAEQRTAAMATAVDTAFVRLRIRRIGATVGFSIDGGTEVILSGATVPTVSALTPYMQLSPTEAVIKTCDVDYFYLGVTGLAR